jgi:Fe-S-cluster containining protein
VECKKCGACCKVIGLDYSLEELREMSGPDAAFIVEHWKPMPRIEAWLRNPKLIKWQRKHFYWCTLLKGKRCSAYESRPGTCSRFQEPCYSDSCGFAKETKKKKKKARPAEELVIRLVGGRWKIIRSSK